MNKEGRPHIAIIDPNTLAVLGLKQLLQNVKNTKKTWKH